MMLLMTAPARVAFSRDWTSRRSEAFGSQQRVNEVNRDEKSHRPAEHIFKKHFHTSAFQEDANIGTSCHLNFRSLPSPDDVWTFVQVHQATSEQLVSLTGIWRETA